MKKLLVAMGVASVALASNFAVAATGDVEFNGTVNTTCTINVTDNGELASINGGNVLSSKAAGGDAGDATVTTTGLNFQVSVADPSGWASTSTGTTAAASMVADMSIGGTTTASGTPVAVGLGDTEVDVNLVASAAPGTSFANGTYDAVVVLTCE